MSLSNDTNSTWKNIEELPLPPNIEVPIERIEIIECLNDIKEPKNEENNESKTEANSKLDETILLSHIHNIEDETRDETLDENDTITNSVESTEEKEKEKEEPTKSLTFIQKIKNAPNYLYKKLNVKCTLCSSV